MVFPLGEWLLFSLGLLAWAEWPLFRFAKFLRILPFIWILGWIIEILFLRSGIWYWHFSRILVILFLFGMAWRRTESWKALPILLTGLTFLGQDLFLVNEPGIFRYDQWVFALVILAVALFSAQSLWGTVLALTGGMLLNLGFSVFLMSGIIRYYDLPDPFLWHFLSVALTGMAGLSQIISSIRLIRVNRKTGTPGILLAEIPKEERLENGALRKVQDFYREE